MIDDFQEDETKDKNLHVRNARTILSKIAKLDYNNRQKLEKGLEAISASLDSNCGIFNNDLYLEMKSTYETISSLIRRSKLQEAKQNIEYLSGLLKQELQ